MHVCIVGAGALGLGYGVWLGTAPSSIEKRVSVSFVVRSLANPHPQSVTVERVDQPGQTRTLAIVEMDIRPPAHSDVILVAVRADQLESTLTPLVGQSEAPVVVLTPMMPHGYEAARALLGRRLRAAMPGVVAYVSDRTLDKWTLRAWIPRVAPTMIDQSASEPRTPASLEALIEAMNDAGLKTKLALGVHESNPATTATFIPLAMALDVAGSVDALLADDDLLELGIRAAKEGMALGHRLGRVAPWASTATHFLGPTLLRMGVALAKQRSPEGVSYAENHFGRKLHAQNVAMAAELVALANERGERSVNLEQLAARLAAVSSDGTGGSHARGGGN